jgi:hypothetical protein
MTAEPSRDAGEAPPKPSFWPLYLMPPLLAGLTIGAFLVGGFVLDLYEDFGFPFLITLWMGMGFGFAWDSVRYSMHAERMPPIVVAGTGILGALVLLSMIGIDSLWEEPWLFGIAVWPGIQMARPFLGQVLKEYTGPEGGSATEGES